MKITASLSSGILRAEGIDRDIQITCDVRNELNGRRKPHEIVVTLPQGRPYYPRTFPIGTWRIVDVKKRSDPYRAPFFIATDAWQLVEEWSTAEVDGKLQYDRPTGKQVKDREYGLHCSTSPTTTGCIKIMLRSDLALIIDAIYRAWRKKEVVYLEVTKEEP